MCGGDIVVMKHSQYPKYLSYALSSPKAIKQKGLGKTKLKVVHTNIPSLKEISIPVPPLSEQKEIVDYLDSSFAKIDKLKENAAKNLEEAKALFQSALKDALEPKEGWEEKTLGEMVKDVKYGTSYNEFSSLGALIDLDVDKDTLVDETIEVAEYLKENKGFGSWSINSKQRIMFAAMLVGDAYQKGTIESTTSVVNSSIVMAVAEQVAIMACIVAATTASSVNS